MMEGQHDHPNDITHHRQQTVVTNSPLSPPLMPLPEENVVLNNYLPIDSTDVEDEDDDDVEDEDEVEVIFHDHPENDAKEGFGSKSNSIVIMDGLQQHQQHQFPEMETTTTTTTTTMNDTMRKNHHTDASSSPSLAAQPKDLISNRLLTTTTDAPFIPWPEEFDDDDDDNDDQQEEDEDEKTRTSSSRQQRRQHIHRGRKTGYFVKIRRIYQTWTFSYMSPLLYKGTQQNDSRRFTNRDLYALPQTMKSFSLFQQFYKYYSPHVPSTIHNKHNNHNNNNRDEQPKRQKESTNKEVPMPPSITDHHQQQKKNNVKHLMYVLWIMVKPTFIPAGYCQLITVLCQVAIPLIVRQILTILERYPNQSVVKEGGLYYVLLLFICTFMNGIGNHRQRHLAIKSGIILRSTMISILYQHILYLSCHGKYRLSSGEVVNLIATDTQKLYEVTQDGHLIWSLPLSAILVTIALLCIMGPTTLVGMVVLIAFVPFVDRVTRIILSIRKKRIQQTDHRIHMINAMLQGMKVTKLNHYEEQYHERITKVRDRELQYLRQELAAWAMSLVVMVSSPVIATASTFTVYVLVNEHHSLTAARTFSVLLLFSALRFPINFAGRFIGKAAQAYSAIQRISRFLDREVREHDNTVLYTEDAQYTNPIQNHNHNDDDIPLQLHNATFYTGSGASATTSNSSDIPEVTTDSTSPTTTKNFTTNFQVGTFNLSIKRGEVVAVCGPVGSGKSVLINGIIEEMPSSKETVIQIKGNVSYMAQNAFILNTTLRENILFGRPYEESFYHQVIDACGLRTDLELLGPSGDLTEIGERGITLSGGQRQRVSLARGVYAKPDLVLLDDPLSALDNGTAKLVFERLIKGPNALLSSAAVVLVTHASYLLNRVDRILIIVDGQNEFLGTWNELGSFEARDMRTTNAIEHIKASVQEDADDVDEKKKISETVMESRHRTDDINQEAGKLMTIEQREHGLSSMATWLLWFRHAGGIPFLLTQMIFLAIDRTAYVGVEWWLARWTSAATNSIVVWGIYFAPQSDGRSAQYHFLRVYSFIILVSVMATTVRSQWGVTGGARAAKKVHATMLTRILGAPMSFFESTPMGRIINRFTYDTEVIDSSLTESMTVFIISWSWYFAALFVMCSIIPWMVFAILPVTVLYWFLLLHYRKSGSDFQRLDAVSRSPIQAMVSEGLDGGAAIRLYRQQQTFLKRFQEAVDVNGAALLNFISAQRWLGFRVEMLGTLVTLTSATLIVTLNNVFRIEPGLVGLVVIWSSQLTVTLDYMVDTFAESEAAITAIERVDAMSRIPQEKSTKSPDFVIPDSWPEHGELEFRDVCMRYRDGLPLALNNLSFKIPAGKKCGIVGRTGSGKSSLCTVLFRLVEIESGEITLDGINLGTIGLSDVRGRPNGMAIIPQDPYLVGGTLRQCIDPFGESSDHDILDCLVSVRLASASDTEERLNNIVEEGGSNYSVGERQLLNLARALLSKPKVLVLDEATASIDGETDTFIQTMLRTKFGGTTKITVAHRLNTIMDFDYILVMDKGKAAEFGSPSKLLEHNGLFAQLVDATGPEGSKALRSMVKI